MTMSIGQIGQRKHRSRHVYGFYFIFYFFVKKKNLITFCFIFSKKVESTDHNGNLLQPIQPNPLFGNFKMYGVTAITDACPLFHSLCLVNNGDCPADTICLPNSRAPSGRSCFGVRDKVVEDFEYQRK